MTSPISRINALSSTDAPAAAPAGWQTVQDNIARHGSLTNYGPLGLYKGLEHIEGSRDGSHQRFFVGQFGGVDSAGVFHGGNTQVIAEDWQLNAQDGRYYVDIWRHFISPQGELLSSEHAYLVENQHGRVFDSGNRRMQPGEAETNLAANLPRWVNFAAPSATTPADVSGNEPGRAAAQQLMPQAPRPGDGLKPSTGGVRLH